ncbi:hypothetical protein BKA83DRAFT_4129264 [Pisolithus microcarpus]|nr:hypothetical protein BKA83DRAFT_4129264 [Pisolithus microcarpus]
MVSMALHAIVLLDDHATLSLFAHIDFHALAGLINVVFAHVTCGVSTLLSFPVLQWWDCCLACTHAVQGVAARFVVTDPTKVADASTSVSGPPPAAAIERSMAQVKHVDDKVLILQIKCIDHEAMKSPPSPPILTITHARTIHVADQTHGRRGSNISRSSSLPFLLLAVYEQSMPLIKHVDDEANIDKPSQHMQIKHIDNEVLIPQIKHVDHEAMKSWIKHVGDKGSM